MSPNEKTGLAGAGCGESFLSFEAPPFSLAAAAAAAARAAFEVPGFFDAEARLPKRLVGLGGTMLALGRAAGAVEALLSAALAVLTAATLAEEPTFAAATGVFLVAGRPFGSPSRVRLIPVAVAFDLSGVASLGGEMLLDSCFRFVD